MILGLENEKFFVTNSFVLSVRCVVLFYECCAYVFLEIGLMLFIVIVELFSVGLHF